MFKFDTTLHRLRTVGTWEAISYLLLLGIAMPLKYVWGYEQAVRVVGMAHGILWMTYVSLAVLGQMDYRWSYKTTVWLFIASLLPFGPFIADAKLLKGKERSAE